MKKLPRNSGSSLFLMEMILALLFLALSCAACIQIFAAARSNQTQARNLNHIQALTTSVGEALEGTDGSKDQLLALLSNGSKKDSDLVWYYDSTWQDCSKEDASYEMTLSTDVSSSEKAGMLTFLRISDEKKLYQINLAFPVCSNEKEDIQ